MQLVAWDVNTRILIEECHNVFSNNGKKVINYDLLLE